MIACIRVNSRYIHDTSTMHPRYPRRVARWTVRAAPWTGPVAAAVFL